MNATEDLEHVSEFPKGELMKHRIGSDGYGAEDRHSKKHDRINGLKIVKYVSDQDLDIYAVNRRGDLWMVRTDG